MSSIIIRDIVAVPADDKLEPLLGYFKKGHSHLGVVYKIVDQTTTGRDPYREVIGIVTLEDIIEEIIMDEIEDEYEPFDDKNNRQILKEKLIYIFTEHEADKVLNEQEIRACLEFLQKYVKPFKTQFVKRDILNVLIRQSRVI